MPSPLSVRFGRWGFVRIFDDARRERLRLWCGVTSAGRQRHGMADIAGMAGW